MVSHLSKASNIGDLGTYDVVYVESFPVVLGGIMCN